MFSALQPRNWDSVSWNNLVKVHTDGKWISWDVNQGLPDTTASVLFVLPVQTEKCLKVGSKRWLPGDGGQREKYIIINDL